MAERGDQLAAEFELVAKGFRELVEGLTDEQWRLLGHNHPTIRGGDEDEGRPVGVIAFHTGFSMRRQTKWLREMASGEPVSQPGFSNAQQAEEHAGTTPKEVLALIDEAAPALARLIRSLSDEELDRRAQLIMGEMSVADAIKRVAIGHVLWHRGSIEATILPVTP